MDTSLGHAQGRQPLSAQPQATRMCAVLACLACQATLRNTTNRVFLSKCLKKESMVAVKRT